MIGRAGTFGAMIEYGLQRKISEHSALAVALSIGVPTGVYLKIKYFIRHHSSIFVILIKMIMFELTVKILCPWRALNPGRFGGKQ